MFEDLGKKLGNLAQGMMKKTGEVAEIASLHTKVLAKKRKAEDELLALGKAFYEAHKDDTAEFAQRIVTINDIYNDIAALEEEIRTLKEKLPEEAQKEADDVVNETADILEEAKKGVKDAAGFVGDIINDAVKGVRNTAADTAQKDAGAADAVQEAAVQEGEGVAETAQETAEEVKNTQE